MKKIKIADEAKTKTWNDFQSMISKSRKAPSIWRKFKKSISAVGPFPTLMQRGRLFLF